MCAYLLQDLERKRNEERVRQKDWEKKHRLGSFRRRAQLPGPLGQEGVTTPSQEQTPGPIPQATTQYLRPIYPTTGTLSGRTTPGRRFSDVGLVTSMLGQRLDFPPPQPSAFPSRYDSRRQSMGSRSASPVRLEHDHRFRRRSPSRYDEDDLMAGTFSPVRYDDRTRSPSRSRQGSETDLRGISPSPLSRRDTLTGMLSPRWPDSRTTSPRTTAVFFPDSEQTFPPPPPSFMDRRGSEVRFEDRRGSDFIEGPPFLSGYELPEHDDDTDSTYRGEYRGESRF